jgi:pSer/pThr/pTyr-binding forkhead associated (FHA) protein
MASLRLMLEGVEVKAAILKDTSITIGRASDNGMVITDPSVSGRHCVVEPTPEGYKLRDLGSTNGTQVNGTTVTEHQLRPGDTIAVVVAKIVFEDKNLPSDARSLTLGDTVRLPGVGTPGFGERTDGRWFWWAILGLVAAMVVGATIWFVLNLKF